MQKEIEKEIWKIIKKYTPILFLHRHTFKLQYPTESKEAVAECVANYPYLNVTINYGDKMIERWKKKESIEEHVLHELCHVITDPLYFKAIQRYATRDEIADERELLTDYICNIVYKNKL